jgi:hypothetical protein
MKAVMVAARHRRRKPMTQMFFHDELDDLTDLELRSKFFSISNDVRRLEGCQGQLYQARQALEQVREEIGDREVRKAVKRMLRPKGPGF